MDKKFLLAALGGAVTAFLLGWVIYGIMLQGFYEANTVHYEGLVKDPPNLLAIFLNNICMSILLAYIFIWSGVASFARGFTMGLLVGVLISLSFDLMILSMFNLYTNTALAVDVIVGTIYTGLVGAVVGGILGSGRKAEATA
jgi:hypothetical protein